MKALFLVSSPGKGHARCAEAIDAALKSREPALESAFLDTHDIIDARVSAAITNGYLRMIAERPALYQRLYDMDRGLYRQLSGELPADADIAEFLAEEQRRSFPELAGRSRLVAAHRNLDTALLNTLVNGVRESRRSPRNHLVMKGLLRLIYRMLARRLEEAVRSRGPDVLIATQMYPAALLRHAIESGDLRQSLIGVITDYGVHGVWVQPTIGRYCVPHASTAQMLGDRGVSGDRVHVTGMPMMPVFADPPAQAEARRRLALDDRPTVLITGGGYGIGTLDAVRRVMGQAPPASRILVSAPTATPGYDELRELAALIPESLALYPWTDDMAVLMAAADVVVGKPGGLTVSEALACGRPFIATRSLGGQEAHNVRFLERYGVGRQVSPEGLAPCLRELFEKPARLRAWQERVAATGLRHGATSVAKLIERCVGAPRARELAG